MCLFVSVCVYMDTGFALYSFFFRHFQEQQNEFASMQSRGKNCELHLVFGSQTLVILGKKDE